MGETDLPTETMGGNEPEWSYKDPFPGDGRVRELLAYLHDHAWEPALVVPVVTRALTDFLGERYSPARTLWTLEESANRNRPTYPLPEFATRNTASIAYQPDIGPVVDDPVRVEAVWTIDEVTRHLAEMREDLLCDRPIGPSSGERLELLRRLHHVLGGAKSVLPTALVNACRTHVLNTFAIVSDVHLPAVFQHLARQGIISRDLLDDFFRPLIEGDQACIVALVRAQYPGVGDDLETMEGLCTELVSRWRGGAARGRKWDTAVELMVDINLWSRPEKAGDAGESLRATYHRDKPAYVGDLAELAPRMRVWNLVSAYLLAMGLGSVTPRDLELARTTVVLDG